MADIDLVIDLAIVMLVAAAVTVIFSKLRQPLILGYLIAGMIIGPNTHPFSLLTDMGLINSLASLGIVLLMFTLGLEFTFGRLREIGLFAIAIGTIEMALMIGVGFWTGILLGFSEGASLLLGAVLAISSTAIVVKTMQDRGSLSRQHSQIVVGILVVEDVAAVLMLALITGFGGTSAGTVSQTIVMLFSMILFFVASIAIGYIFVPRLISRVARKMPAEVLLLVALAFCFGLSVLSAQLGFSLAIGAFIAGMLIGESEDVDLVVLKMTPIKEMFVAVFFVTMGMLFDPSLLLFNIVPVILVLAAFIIGKTLLIGTGSLMFGFPAKTAFLAGTGMIALGEFSFIICRAGIDAGMAGEGLYSVTVVVATITAFLLPVSAKNGDRIYAWLTRHAPQSLKSTADVLQGSLVSVRSQSRQTPETREAFHRTAVIALVDVALIAIIALAAKAALGIRDSIAVYFGTQDTFVGIVISVSAIALLLPPIISLSRNLEKMIEMVVRQAPKQPEEAAAKGQGIRRALAGITIVMIGIALILIAAPFALDRALMSTISPAVFLMIIVMIILLAWFLNRTLYRSFSMHFQRDIMKEHVTVAGPKQAASMTEPQLPESAPSENKLIMIEGKEE